MSEVSLSPASLSNILSYKEIWAYIFSYLHVFDLFLIRSISRNVYEVISCSEEYRIYKGCTSLQDFLDRSIKNARSIEFLSGLLNKSDICFYLKSLSAQVLEIYFTSLPDMIPVVLKWCRGSSCILEDIIVNMLNQNPHALDILLSSDNGRAAVLAKRNGLHIPIDLVIDRDCICIFSHLFPFRASKSVHIAATYRGGKISKYIQT